MNLRTKAFFLGFIGDMILKTIVNLGGNFGGLKVYFEQHDILETVFISAGSMFLATLIYEQTGLPLTIPYVFIYGGLLNIIFKKIIMLTLENTYKELNLIQSFLWGGLPMLMILI